MYTILMQDNGSLVCTTPTERIRQSDNLADVLRIIAPKAYKNVDLSTFVAVAKYVNPGNVAKLEYLEVNNPEYKTDYIEYRIPITSEMTQFAGDVEMHLTFTKNDEDANKQYVAQSGTIVLPIEPVDEYFTDEASLSAIDEKIAALQDVAKTYDETKADNIAKEGTDVYLTANGEKIGDTVSVDGGGVTVIEI